MAAVTGETSLPNSGKFYNPAQYPPQRDVEFQHLWKVMDDIKQAILDGSISVQQALALNAIACHLNINVDNLTPCSGSIINVAGDFGVIGDIQANNFIGNGQNLLNVVTFDVITYSGLVALIGTSNLKNASYYLVTDFSSTFKITNTVDGTAPIEPLLLFATSINTISPTAMSVINPYDIIQYSVTDTSALAPNNPAISKGVITFRKDTVKNLSAYYDWRGVLFRRWERTAGGGIFFWNIDPAPFVGSGGQAFLDEYSFYSADGAGNRACSFGPNTYNIVCGDNNSGIEIGPDSGFFGGINIGNFNHGIKIGSNCAMVGSAGPFQPPGIYIGSNNLYIEIGKRSYGVWIGFSCYAVTLGNQNSNVVIVDNTWRRTIFKGFSNTETTLDITGLTNIDFGVVSILGGLIVDSGRFCGLIRLTSTNATETINTIYAGNSTVFSPYRFIPEAGLVVTFNDSSVAGGNIILNTQNIPVNGSLSEYIIFDRYMTNLGNTEPNYHLEYTNVLSIAPLVSSEDLTNNLLLMGG